MSLDIKTSLSTQGYAIYKCKFTENELDEIKNDLTIKPFTCPGYGNEEDVTPYKLYKENADKIYIPWFYGRNKFGIPDINKRPEPESISIEWSAERSMRPYQKDIIKTYLDKAKEIGGGIISVGCGRGKCLAKGTMIPLSNGNSKKVEDLVIGDNIINDHYTNDIYYEQSILSLGSGISEMYEISPDYTIENKDSILGQELNNNISSFTPYTVNEDHILTLSKTISKYNKISTIKVDIPIKDFMALPVEIQDTYRNINSPFNNINSVSANNIYHHDEYLTFSDIDFNDFGILNKIEPYDFGHKFALTILKNKIYNISQFTEYIQTKINKFKYFCNFYNGFINCMHTKYNRKVENQSEYPFILPISETNNSFNIIQFILKNIGITYSLYTIKNIKYIKILYDERIVSVKIPIKITHKGQGEYYGFELGQNINGFAINYNCNGRFLLSDRTITHNTVMGLKIAQELGVKTLILIHKDFLKNQWEERIKEYLPEARIGYIQGKTLDIHRKDIVLAMIQSLSDPRKDKDYPANLFESFGLVIADECHHLAARQFCRSLAKYPFKYTLGLSATPDRADGLTRVFKHFLGDIVYKDTEIKKTAEDIALEHIPDSTVEIYIYKNNGNAKYSKEELNYKKKADIVKMKSNVANCKERTEFILSFLPRLILEGRTILILSCRRAHIDQIETMINDMKIPECTVGQYVGGMKQEHLDISASKRIIVATYDMAEEAFDCKTLNTLIYATPHKNIKQAVGRILREEKKKRKLIPLIIDVQEVFSTFKGWNKLRETYYKKAGYPMKIYEADVKTVCGKPSKPEIKFIRDVSNNNTKSKNCKAKINEVQDLENLAHKADDELLVTELDF